MHQFVIPLEGSDPEPVPDRTLIYEKNDGNTYIKGPDGVEKLFSHPAIAVDVIDDETILLRHHPQTKMQGIYKRVKEQ